MTTAEEAFCRYDTDGDGRISRAEAMVQFLDLMGETEGTPTANIEATLNEYFDGADENGDGMLSVEEFRVFHATIMGLSAVLSSGAIFMGKPPEEESAAIARVRSKSPPPGRASDVNPYSKLSSLDTFNNISTKREHKLLTLEEAIMLLRTKLGSMGQSVEWVTAEWLREMFALVRFDGDGEMLSEGECMAFIERYQRVDGQLGTITQGTSPVPAHKAHKQQSAQQGVGTGVGTNKKATSCVII
jgi:hypothetical protein